MLSHDDFKLAFNALVEVAKAQTIGQTLKVPSEFRRMPLVG